MRLFNSSSGDTKKTKNDDFTAWWEGHFGARPADYTPLANPTIDATISERGGARAESRVWAWVVRHSDGLHSNRVIHSKADPRPLGVSDCARDIGVSKGLASELLGRLEEDGEIYLSGPGRRVIIRLQRGCACASCAAGREAIEGANKERTNVHPVVNVHSPFLLLRNPAFLSSLPAQLREKVEQFQSLKAELETELKAAAATFCPEGKSSPLKEDAPAEKVAAAAAGAAVVDRAGHPGGHPDRREKPTRVVSPAVSNGAVSGGRLAELEAIVAPFASEACDHASAKFLERLDRALNGAPLEKFVARVRRDWRTLKLKKLGMLLKWAEDVGKWWATARESYGGSFYECWACGSDAGLSEFGICRKCRAAPQSTAAAFA
jgi:hypothetical protein